MNERRDKNRPNIKCFRRDKGAIVTVAVRGLKRRLLSDRMWRHHHFIQKIHNALEMKKHGFVRIN